MEALRGSDGQKEFDRQIKKDLIKQEYEVGFCHFSFTNMFKSRVVECLRFLVLAFFMTLVVFYKTYCDLALVLYCC